MKFSFWKAIPEFFKAEEEEQLTPEERQRRECMACRSLSCPKSPKYEPEELMDDAPQT